MATAVTERRQLPREHTLTTREQEMDHFIALANEARRDYEDHAKEYRDLAYIEDTLEAERPGKQEEVKLRLMTESPSLAATPAEKLARNHPDYLAHLEKQRTVVRQKDDARTRMVSAVLRCKTSIAALKAIGGWV